MTSSLQAKSQQQSFAEFLHSKTLETQAGLVSTQPWILLPVPDRSLLRLTSVFLQETEFNYAYATSFC